MSDAQPLLPLEEFAAAALPTEADDLRDMAILDGVPEHLFVLMLDQARPDVVAQRDAIKRLLAEGYSEREIAAVTPFNHAAIRRRLNLDHALPEILDLYRAGGASAAVLEQCAKLPEAVQRELLAVAVDKGKLTATDVANARKARAVAALDGLPDEMFAPEPAPPPAADWRAEVRAELEQVARRIPEDANDLRVHVQRLLKELEAIKA